LKPQIYRTGVIVVQIFEPFPADPSRALLMSAVADGIETASAALSGNHTGNSAAFPQNPSLFRRLFSNYFYSAL
jgi:hypothetical protein